MQAEEAAQQESAAARTPSRPRPPTAVLGYAPPSQASPSPSTMPSSGKHSWPAHFFDDSRKKKIRQAADSEQESAAGSRHQDESVDTSAVSSRMGNGDSMAGDGLDFGAAWRDAAQSPLPSQSAAPAPEDGASVCSEHCKFPYVAEFVVSCCDTRCLTKHCKCCQQFAIHKAATAAACHAGIWTTASAAPSSIPSRVY